MAHRQPWSFSVQLKRNNNAKWKSYACTTLDKHEEWEKKHTHTK